MSEQPTPEEMIRANADLVLSVARNDLGEEVGFDAAGVRWLDSYIESLFEQGGVEASEELCDRLGSFLGTCIIETYGGRWQDTEYGWAVVIKDDFAVFPFNKALKHLTEGAGDSVLSLYTTIPAMIGHAGGATAAATDGEPASAGARSRSVMSRIGGFFRRR